MLKPRANVKKPKLTWTVENPIFSALKKKLFTGPLGKMLDNKYDEAEPIMPPIIIPAIMLPNLLFAISLLFASQAKNADCRG